MQHVLRMLALLANMRLSSRACVVDVGLVAQRESMKEIIDV